MSRPSSPDSVSTQSVHECSENEEEERKLISRPLLSDTERTQNISKYSVNEDVKRKLLYRPFSLDTECSPRIHDYSLINERKSISQPLLPETERTQSLSELSVNEEDERTLIIRPLSPDTERSPRIHDYSVNNDDESKFITQPSSSDTERTQSIPDYSVNEDDEQELMLEYTSNYTTELEFAIELVCFVLKYNNVQYNNYMHFLWITQPQWRSKFDSKMKYLVRLSLKKNKINAYNMISKHVCLDCDQPSYEEFKYFLNFTSLEVEKVYINEYSFLFYCIMIAQMSSVALSRGMTFAPDFSIMLICRTFRSLQRNSFLSSDPWDRIKAVALIAISLLEKEAVKK